MKSQKTSAKKYLRACEIHDKYFLQIFVKELGSTEGYVLKKDLRSPYQSTFLAKNFAVKRYCFYIPH